MLLEKLKTKISSTETKTYYFILLIHYNFYILCFRLQEFTYKTLDFHPFPWTIYSQKIKFSLNIA